MHTDQCVSHAVNVCICLRYLLLPVALLELCISLNTALQVLKKHEDEFLNVVDPKLHLHRLKHKKVITEALISKIENADSEDAKYILFEHLLHNADVAALMEYCKMVIAADAFPKMQKLGEKMLNELALEGTYVPTMWSHMLIVCTCVFVCACIREHMCD